MLGVTPGASSGVEHGVESNGVCHSISFVTGIGGLGLAWLGGVRRTAFIGRYQTELSTHNETSQTVVSCINNSQGADRGDDRCKPTIRFVVATYCMLGRPTTRPSHVFDHRLDLSHVLSHRQPKKSDRPGTERLPKLHSIFANTEDNSGPLKQHWRVPKS